MQLKDKRQRRQ